MSLGTFLINEFEAVDVEKVQNPLHELLAQNVFYQNRKDINQNVASLESNVGTRKLKHVFLDLFRSFQTTPPLFVVTETCVLRTKIIEPVYVKSFHHPTKACSTKIFQAFISQRRVGSLGHIPSIWHNMHSSPTTINRNQARHTASCKPIVFSWRPIHSESNAI